jgi:hypothetical protein
MRFPIEYFQRFGIDDVGRQGVNGSFVFIAVHAWGRTYLLCHISRVSLPPHVFCYSRLFFQKSSYTG